MRLIKLSRTEGLELIFKSYHLFPEVHIILYWIFIQYNQHIFTAYSNNTQPTQQYYMTKHMT